MKSILSPDSPLYKIMNRLTDWLLANICFIIGCLPIITIGTSACSLSAVNFKLNNQEDIKVVRYFFQQYKSNLSKSIIAFLIILLFVISLVYNIQLFHQTGSWFFDIYQSLMILLLVLFILIGLYLFPLMSQYENTVSQYFKNSILMLVSHLFTTFLIGLSVVTIVVLALQNDFTLAWSIGLFLSLGFALINSYHCSLLKKIFSQYQ